MGDIAGQVCLTESSRSTLNGQHRQTTREPMNMPGPASAMFCQECFESIIDLALSAGYNFCRFDDPDHANDAFILRHDVDISPTNALRLGEIAADRNVRSNFFFQLNAETYNLLDSRCLATVSRLRALGHCVGLHIDQNLMGDDEASICRTLDWFSSTITPIDRVVSFHRPTTSVVGRRYERFVNAYDPQFFDVDRYLSDSRRSLEFLGKLQGWIAEKRPRIQLLLHPEWWTAAESVEDIWTRLRNRREHELSVYVLANFAKVFGDVVKVQGRDFGI